MAKSLKGTYWAVNFGNHFNPLNEVNWKLFASSSSKEVEKGMAKVLSLCKDPKYSYQVRVRQYGKWVIVDLIAKRYWWALEDHLFDEVSCFVQEWVECPDKEYKAFKE